MRRSATLQAPRSADLEAWSHGTGSTAGGDCYAREVLHLVERGRTLCGVRLPAPTPVSAWCRAVLAILVDYGQGDEDCRRCARALKSREARAEK